MKTLNALTFACGALLLSPVAQSADVYTAQDLEPPGAAFSWRTIQGLNDLGQVAGSIVVKGGAVHAAVTGPGGQGTQDLGTLGGRYGAAQGINNQGVVVGQSSDASGVRKAFLAGSAGMTELALPGPKQGGSLAVGINDLCDVIGWRIDADKTRPDTGFLYKMRENFYLNTPGIPYAINGAGKFALVYRDVLTISRNNYGGDYWDIGYVVPEDGIALNKTMQAVGAWRDCDQSGCDSYRGFKFEPFDRHHKRIYAKDSDWTRATSLNDDGDFVGTYLRAGLTHAYIGRMSSPALTDLDTLVTLPAGVRLVSATRINAVGQISAWGSDGHAYLLSPKALAAGPAGAAPAGTCP